MMILNTKYNIRDTKKGFTLIEAMVLLFVFSITIVTFYQVFSAGTMYIMDSKNRLGAVSLANERMEMVRNLAYDDIGTVGGEVDGNIPQEQDVEENGRTYHIRTEVRYVQDSFDGVYPADTAFEDYKKVVITISWTPEPSVIREVQLVSRFVPQGLEVANPGDGILSINVFSDQPGGTGISGSTVHVVNAETGLNTTLETDSTGNVTLMGDNVTASIQKYEIQVSKSDYETVTTLPPYPSSAFNPVDVHASVVIGSINMANIVQNRLSDLRISAVNHLGEGIPNIGFHLKGGRIVGVETIYPNAPIYNLDEDGTTGSDGNKDYNDISPGEYSFSLLSSVTGYELIDTDPADPFSLTSENPLVFKARLADNSATSLLVRIIRIDGEDALPVSGAQVQLSNDSGYSATVASSYNGAAFFPASSDPFLEGNYNLKITADGFNEHNSTVTVNANQLKVENITLDPQ